MMIKQEKEGAAFTPERVNALSDGIFAIILTIMVLELKKPEEATFAALFKLWPTWISYAVSYLFIAIVWINHHYVLRHAGIASLRLIWANFLHLFTVSLVPFLTVWIAETKLAAIPVAMYAVVFLLVNVTYLALVWEIMCTNMNTRKPDPARRFLHIRSFITIFLFAFAAAISFLYPLLGFGIICCCLLLYLKPEWSGMKDIMKRK